MDAANVIFCTGDPVLDLYSFGKVDNEKFQTKKLVRSYGGALNVWKNAEAILGKHKVRYISPLKHTFPILLKDTMNLYALTRYIDEDSGRLLLEGTTTPSHQKSNFYTNRIKDISHNIRELDFSIVNKGKIGLIISEYNKGAFNCAFHRHDDFPKFDFCIIDSRYRTLHIPLMSTSKVRIWHATGEEYEPTFAKNFHYVLHTNASDPVRILTGEGEVICKNHPKLLVPNTNIVNTCGAGDTFTAAAASYIVNQPNINHETLLNACEFAIRCCQEVIGTKCTTQTTIQLE